MATLSDTAYIVFDTESVVDGALLSRVLYPGDDLSPQDAIREYIRGAEEGSSGKKPFIPVSFHVPVAIGVARVGSDYMLRDISSLDAPRFDPQTMVKLFWKGLQMYSGATLVDFNGRGFDMPLLTLSAFRFGVSCPRYFDDSDRFGFRYRFTAKHIDLMEWMTEYGAFYLKGGLNLLAKMLGKPGKLDTKGDQVDEIYARGDLQRINDYCLHDVLDTYFIFLRTRVLAGKISLEDEHRIVAVTKAWLKERAKSLPGLERYIEEFGDWDPTPLR